MERAFIRWAGIFGFLTIVFGAFGAHALKEALSPEQLISFQTGVRYQAWHTLALLAIGLAPIQLPYQKGMLICWILGIILFSFSIYLLATSSITGLNVKWLGPVTPLGGISLMLGWLLLITGSLKRKAVFKKP